jgi:hypothetical protein
VGEDTAVVYMDVLVPMGEEVVDTVKEDRTVDIVAMVVEKDMVDTAKKVVAGV